MSREWSRRSIEEIARKIGKGLGGNTKFYTVAYGTNSSYAQKAVGMIDTSPVGGVYHEYVLPMLYPRPNSPSDWSICDDIVLNQRAYRIMLYAFPNSVFENKSSNSRLRPIAFCLSGNLGDTEDLAKNTTKCDYSIELYNSITGFEDAELMDKIYNKELDSNLIQRWNINDKLFITDPQGEDDEHYIDIEVLNSTMTVIGRDYPNSSIPTTYFLQSLDYFHNDYLDYYPIHYDSNNEYDYRPEFLRISGYGAVVFGGTMIKGDLYTAWKNNYVGLNGGPFMYLVSRKK